MKIAVTTSFLMAAVVFAHSAAAQPTDPLGQIAGKRCWGPFITPVPVGDQDLGAVVFEFSSHDPVVGDAWRAWGRVAHDSPRESPGAFYEHTGNTGHVSVTPEGTIKFKGPNPRFTWELTPLPNGGYATKITGGAQGATGTLTCAPRG